METFIWLIHDYTDVTLPAALSPFTILDVHSEAYDNADPRNGGFAYLRTRLNGDSGIKRPARRKKGVRPHRTRSGYIPDSKCLSEFRKSTYRTGVFIRGRNAGAYAASVEVGQAATGLAKFSTTTTTHKSCIAKKLYWYSSVTWSVETLNEVVDAELDALPAAMRARFEHVSELIEEFGLERVREPHVRHLRGPLSGRCG
jgi:hypothetical protein